MEVLLVAYVPTILAIFGLTVFVYLKNPNSLRNRLFAVLTTAILLWLISLFIADISNSPTIGLHAIRTGIFFANLIPLFFMYFCLTFPSFKKINLQSWLLLAIVPIVLMAVSYTSLMVGGVEYKNLGAQPTEVGTFYVIQLAYFVVYFLASFIILFRKSRRADAREKAQARFIFAGAFSAILLNIFASFVFVIIDLSRYTVLLGGPAVLLFVAAMSYAIVKHRLFDIRLIVARSVAYILLLGTLAATYGVAVFGVSNLFFGGQTANAAQQAVYIILAIFLAFTFQPLRRFFEKLTDKLFYRDKYETQDVLNNINSILTSQIDLKIITEATLRVVCENLRVVSGRFVVLDSQSIYEEASYGLQNNKKLDFNELQMLHSNIIIAEELEDGQIKNLLTSRNLAASLRLKTQEGVVGYILLGPKQTGSVYVEQDIKLLEILGDELAIAVQNARSFEKIADFNVTLQKRIEEATKRLRVQNRKLKELDEAKDEFISMASHQLRTPLTSIKGYLSMLEEGDGGKLNKKQFDFADSAYVSAQRMVFLISDMLNVSRINTGKLVIQKSPLDLNAVVKDEVKQLQRTAESRSVKLDYTEPKEKPPLLSLDEGKMRQVIMNFIDNAIYYAPNTTVEIYLELVDGKVRFCVKDHGIGVPKEAQKHLFTKFYRASNAQQARPDGTGLGLFMAKMVIEMQGGSLIFSSQEGKGSTFGFEFPMEIVQASSTAATTKATAEVPGR